VDPEVLAALARSGCTQIMYGVETGSERSARRIRKPLARARLEQVLGWTRAEGIRAAGFFMVGFPWEDATDLEATAELALGGHFDVVYLFSATPLPGTELWERCGRPELPRGFDFRLPQLGYGLLSGDEYTARFTALRAAFDEHNRRSLIESARRLAGLPPTEDS